MLEESEQLLMDMYYEDFKKRLASENGKKGGAVKSERKSSAVKQNLTKANKARKQKALDNLSKAV
jgi:hypothetical protein